MNISINTLHKGDDDDDNNNNNTELQFCLLVCLGVKLCCHTEGGTQAEVVRE